MDENKGSGCTVQAGELGCCRVESLVSIDERGQMVLLDFGSIHNGYCGDMTRMIVMGRADDRQREVYDWVLQAQLRGLEAVRPVAGGLRRDRDAPPAVGDSFR